MEAGLSCLSNRVRCCPVMDRFRVATDRFCAEMKRIRLVCQRTRLLWCRYSLMRCCSRLLWYRLGLLFHLSRLIWFHFACCNSLSGFNVTIPDWNDSISGRNGSYRVDMMTFQPDTIKFQLLWSHLRLQCWYNRLVRSPNSLLWYYFRLLWSRFSPEPLHNRKTMVIHTLVLIRINRILFHFGMIIKFAITN